VTGDDPRDEPRTPRFLEQRKKALKALAILFTVPSVFLVVFVFGMIVRNELAHDEKKCPFVLVETRELPGARVTDERRQCVEGIVEHRWVLARPGTAKLEVGRRRLASSFYAEGVYTWRAFVESEKVRVHVENTGAPPVTYREEIAAGGAAPR
jgi:hypothetical protein